MFFLIIFISSFIYATSIWIATLASSFASAHCALGLTCYPHNGNCKHRKYAHSSADRFVIVQLQGEQDLLALSAKGTTRQLAIGVYFQQAVQLPSGRNRRLHERETASPQVFATAEFPCSVDRDTHWAKFGHSCLFTHAQAWLMRLSCAPLHVFHRTREQEHVQVVQSLSSLAAVRCLLRFPSLRPRCVPRFFRCRSAFRRRSCSPSESSSSSSPSACSDPSSSPLSAAAASLRRRRGSLPLRFSVAAASAGGGSILASVGQKATAVGKVLR